MTGNYAVNIEWYRVRLVGEPVLGEQRNPSTKQNVLRFIDDDEKQRYIFQDFYPDGRYTETIFNYKDVLQLVVKYAAVDAPAEEEAEDGGEA